MLSSSVVNAASILTAGLAGGILAGAVGGSLAAPKQEAPQAVAASFTPAECAGVIKAIDSGPMVAGALMDLHGRMGCDTRQLYELVSKRMSGR